MEHVHINMNNSTCWRTTRREALIPLPVEIAALNGHGVHIFVGDGHADLIGSLVLLDMNR